MLPFSKNTGKYKTAIFSFSILVLFIIGFFIFQQFSTASDNCKDVDGEEVCIQSVSPKTGPLSGGDTLTITGKNFPYAPTSSYVQDGLVLFFDGINNTGQGDKYHSDTTRTWRSVDQNDNYSTLLQNSFPSRSPGDSSCPNAVWHSNGFLFNNNCYFGIIPGYDGQKGTWTSASAINTAVPNFPVGNNSNTVEAVYDPSFLTTVGGHGLYGIGRYTGDSTVNNLRFQATYAECNALGAKQPLCFRNYWWSNDIDPKINATATMTKVRNLGITFDNSLATKARRFYYNGSLDDDDYLGDPSKGKTVEKYVALNCPAPTGNNCRDNKALNLNSSGGFVIGAAMYTNPFEFGTNVKMLAVRLYNRALTKQEVQQNYHYDELRFLSPPTIKIDDKDCENTVIVSTTQLICKIPANEVAGAKDVTYSYVSNSGTNIHLKIPMVYQYLSDPDNSPQISTVSPNVLPKYQDSTISITGKQFGESANVTSVTIGGKTCSLIEQTQTSIKCHYPGFESNENGGFKDVIINRADATTQPIVGFSSFYALEISKNPIKYNVYPTPTGYGFQNVSIQNDYLGVIDVNITVPYGITVDDSNIVGQWEMNHSGQVYTFSTTKNLDEDVVNSNDIVKLLESVELIGQAGGNVSVNLVNHSW